LCRNGALSPITLKAVLSPAAALQSAAPQSMVAGTVPRQAPYFSGNPALRHRELIGHSADPIWGRTAVLPAIPAMALPYGAIILLPRNP
jgi:hypothetical protein